ncbi:Protein kinase family protein with leucine-rich repeat domain, partial [Prunus dulcis]
SWACVRSGGAGLALHELELGLLLRADASWASCCVLMRAGPSLDEVGGLDLCVRAGQAEKARWAGARWAAPERARREKGWSELGLVLRDGPRALAGLRAGLIQAAFKAPSSQVPLYLWGGSIVHSKKFVANLHRVTTDAQFQKWRAAYASAIPDDVRVRLLKSRKDNEPLVDANDPDARIITFHPFYFSLGFKFPLSKLFKEVFCAMGCAPSQCTPNVYRAIMCFENLSRFFMLELTVREFFYFFEVRHFERYAQVRVYNAKLFNSFSQGDHAWHDDVLEVSGRWEGDVGDGPLVPITYCDVSDISKQLEFGPDMAKVRRALNIPPRFREWRWLLSGYREEDGGLPLSRMSKGGSRMVLTLMICSPDRKNVLLNLSLREKLPPNLREVKLPLRMQRIGEERHATKTTAVISSKMVSLGFECIRRGAKDMKEKMIQHGTSKMVIRKL